MLFLEAHQIFFLSEIQREGEIGETFTEGGGYSPLSRGM